MLHAARLLGVSLPFLLAVSPATGDAPNRLPGPAPQVRPQGYDAVAENQTCERCHPDITTEWRASLHRRAWEDPIFTAGYTIESLPFCHKCHAPEADPASTPGEPFQRVGIGCVTCHVPSAGILSSHASPRSPHPVLQDPRFATASACEGCHQFEFPAPQREPMQSTINEHRASRYASTPCQGCHMPSVRGTNGKPHRSHAWSVVGNTALLRSAVQVQAQRDGDDTVVVRISTARVGHDVPTGDIFRRLEVRGVATGTDVIEAFPIELARRFSMRTTPGGPQRVPVGDDRLRSNGAMREVRLRFPRSLAGRTVTWRVVYARMGAMMATVFGLNPSNDEVVLAEGTLQPERRTTR